MSLASRKKRKKGEGRAPSREHTYCSVTKGGKEEKEPKVLLIAGSAQPRVLPREKGEEALMPANTPLGCRLVVEGRKRGKETKEQVPANGGGLEGEEERER